MARRTKEEAQATRERLLDAAEMLFQAQGVSQTTLQQIAQAANATRGAVYWHFKDKSDVVAAMVNRVTLPTEAMAARGEEASGDPLETLRACAVHALRRTATDAHGVMVGGRRT